MGGHNRLFDCSIRVFDYYYILLFDYRIAGYFRGGKFSRMHDAVTFEGKIFADG